MKKLIISLAAKWIPEIIDYLIERANKPGKIGKFGKAAKELKDVVIVIENATKDGIIDEKEMKKISGESMELALAIWSLFDKPEIVIKK